MTLYAGSRSPRAITSDATAGGAGADGNLLNEMAGTTRFLSEIINGDATVGGNVVEPCAPPSPLWGRRRPGHDHSGGMAGVPQKHTVWQHAYGWIAGGVVEFDESPRVERDGGTGVIIECVIPSWVPPGRIYRALQPQVLVQCTTAGCDLTLTVRNNGTTATYTQTGISTGATLVTTPGLVACAPGAFNRMTWKVEATAIGAGGIISLLWLGLSQIYDEPDPAVTI